MTLRRPWRRSLHSSDWPQVCWRQTIEEPFEQCINTARLRRKRKGSTVLTARTRYPMKLFTFVGCLGCRSYRCSTAYTLRGRCLIFEHWNHKMVHKIVVYRGPRWPDQLLVYSFFQECTCRKRQRLSKTAKGIACIAQKGLPLCAW